MLWGHRNDPVNFHRCLQDFDRRLPDLLDALRAGRPARSLTSDHGCDPTTPSTDHSREHALLLAYVQGRNAAGRIHEGRVRRRRRDGERVARRQGAAPRHPGHADPRALMAAARYLVDDLEAAVRFYAGRLGFAERRSFGPVTLVQRGDLEIWLSAPGSSGREQEGATPGGWNRIVLEVTDLDEAVEGLPPRGRAGRRASRQHGAWSRIRGRIRSRSSSRSDAAERPRAGSPPVREGGRPRREARLPAALPRGTGRVRRRSFDAVAEAQPARLLEVGCGKGEFGRAHRTRDSARTSSRSTSRSTWSS